MTGKVVVITGGSRGLGRATAERFAAEGSHVITGSTREPDEALPDHVIWQPLDMRNQASVIALLDRAMADYGRLDVLVNNAGIEIEETVETSSDDDWQRMADINMRGVFEATRAAVPMMRKGGGGSIVNLGSISAFVSDPNLALYNASKAWVVSFTRSVAVDHGKDGIRCNAVCPGWIMTDMLMQTFGQAADVSAAIQDAVCLQAWCSIHSANGGLRWSRGGATIECLAGAMLLWVFGMRLNASTPMIWLVCVSILGW